jgi:BirA family biotin operon repressor/biotin-[acetyl-CoA-carboxylase] ligase
LHADDLLSRLGQTQVIGRDIRVFQETTSTNDVVERLARDGVREGAVVFAEAQTKGRGRLGRRWHSAPGQGLWFSVLLRPNFLPQQTTKLTVAATTAVVRALASQTGLSPTVKWPNDVLVGGKKLAGILTELSAEPDRVRYVVLGIGVDVNLSQSDFPPELRGVATSLRTELGRPIDRAELAVAILRELDADYARVCRGEFEAVATEWEARCATLGREIVLAVGDRQVRGRAESLDADGALLLRTQHGHLERVIGGDVTLAG